MVVEFSRRLRAELIKFQEGISELRSRAGTSDTARMSIESTRSLEPEGPGKAKHYIHNALNDPAAHSPES